MNAFEYSKYAIEAFSRYDFIQSVEIILLDEPVAKIKAVITEDSFINVFYNAMTAKYSFTLIKNNKRIFGVDNTRKWHIHPFKNPESHEDTIELSLLDFLEIIKSNKDQWGKTS